MSFIDDAALDKLRSVVAEPGPGDVIDDRFELIEHIGEGAMGVVFSAHDREHDGEVALKILRASDDNARLRFEREASAIDQVSHPAVVGYIAHGVYRGASYLVTARLSGLTLSERLRRGPLSTTDTIVLGRRCADALCAVHAAGLAHRDLKPSNVFVVDADVADARLLDFGLARSVDPEARITATGALVGTPGYMAPEQVRADELIDGKADIFALGCVLYECLSARPAFAADDIEALLSKLLLETPTPIGEQVSDLPPALEALLASMLAKDARERPDAVRVARELRALETSQPTAVPEEGEAGPGLALGSVIADKYELQARIGAGGMGVVFQAKHRDLGKRVAIKVMRRSGSEADEARFLREAQATSQLESVHALRVLDVGRLDDGAPFLVMEYLPGHDLAQHLARRGPLPIDEAVQHVLDACEALAEAHALGIVHRDLKPSNLFLSQRRDGSPLIKVLDFGISKITKPLTDASHAELSITAPSAVMGSAAYMSPEQLKGAAHVDERSDVWALGVVLHELLTGSPPFAADSPAAVGARIAAEPPSLLRASLPQAPAALERVILRCLEKDPAARYPNVAALVAALRPFVGDAPAEPVEAMPRAGWRWLAVAGAVVVIGVVASWGTSTTPAASESHADTSSPRSALDLPPSTIPAASAEPSAAAAPLPTAEPSLESSLESGAEASPESSSEPTGEPSTEPKPRSRPVAATRPVPPPTTAPAAPPPAKAETKPAPKAVDVTDPALDAW